MLELNSRPSNYSRKKLLSSSKYATHPVHHVFLPINLLNKFSTISMTRRRRPKHDLLKNMVSEII